MYVEIQDTRTGRVYYATDVAHCRFDGEREAYQAAVAIEQTVTKGDTLAVYHPGLIPEHCLTKRGTPRKIKAGSGRKHKKERGYPLRPISYAAGDVFRNWADAQTARKGALVAIPEAVEFAALLLLQHMKGKKNVTKTERLELTPYA